MITLRDNTGKKIKVPICWEETSTDLFQRYVKEWDLKDRVQLFCIQTGYDYDKVKGSTDEDLQYVLEKCTDYVFIQNTKFESLPVPTVFQLRTKYIPIPKDISNLTVEQNLYIKQAMSTAKDLRELISLAVAVYLQPLYDENKFETERALELEEEIKKMPITETFPIGFFLLNRLKNTGKDGFLYWRQAIRSLTLNATQLLRQPKSISLNLLRLWVGLTDMHKPTEFYHELSYKKNYRTLCRC